MEAPPRSKVFLWRRPYRNGPSPSMPYNRKRVDNYDVVVVVTVLLLVVVVVKIIIIIASCLGRETLGSARPTLFVPDY